MYQYFALNTYLPLLIQLLSKMGEKVLYQYTPGQGLSPFEQMGCTDRVRGKKKEITDE